MRSAIGILVTFIWAWWFGGLMWLFISIQSLFAADRATAKVAAPQMFLVFERYQLALAGGALACLAIWRVLVRRRILTAVLALHLVAAAGALIIPIAITRPMEQMRHQGRTESAEFKKLHGISMAVFMGEAVALLAAGVMIPLVNRAASEDR